MRDRFVLLTGIGFLLFSTGCVISCNNGTGGSAGAGGSAGGGSGGVGGVGGSGGSAGGGSGGSAGGGGCASCAACTDSAIDLSVPGTAMGTTVGGTTLLEGGPTCPFPLGSGGEVVYSVTVPAGATQILFTLTPTGNSDPAMYVRSACGDELTEVKCVDEGAGGGVETLGLTVTAGEQLFVIVDAYNDTFEGDFTLDVSTPAPESGASCSNLLDDDGDGFADCLDDDCSSLPICQSGNGVYGTGCMASNECFSTNGDPACIDEATFFFPHGYCSEQCSIAVNDCFGDGVCLDVGLGPSGTCFDGCATDGDCLSYQTCVDPPILDPNQPSGQLICYPYEKSCSDGVDNDDDGFDDCNDYDCIQSPDCAATLCGTYSTLAVVGDNAGDTAQFGTNALTGSCGNASTFEQIFSYTPPANQSVTFTMDSPTDQLLYVFTDCADSVGTELDCQDLGVGGDTETLGPVMLSAGVTYYIAVDAYSGAAAGPFNLNVTVN